MMQQFQRGGVQSQGLQRVVKRDGSLFMQAATDEGKSHAGANSDHLSEHGDSSSGDDPNIEKKLWTERLDDVNDDHSTCLADRCQLPFSDKQEDEV